MCLCVALFILRLCYVFLPDCYVKVSSLNRSCTSVNRVFSVGVAFCEVCLNFSAEEPTVSNTVAVLCERAVYCVTTGVCYVEGVDEGEVPVKSTTSVFFTVAAAQVKSTTIAGGRRSTRRRVLRTA